MDGKICCLRASDVKLFEWMNTWWNGW